MHRYQRKQRFKNRDFSHVKYSITWENLFQVNFD
nr:MAG TPA: Protein of unknown function (DUF1659) [Caudoviricetes sp.]